MDTIPEIVAHSISPFVLRDESVCSQIDTAGVWFSPFGHIPTAASPFAFDVDAVANIALQEYSLAGFSGIPTPVPQPIQSTLFLLFVFCFVLFAFWFNKEGATLAINFKNIFSGGVRNRAVFKEQITITGIWSEVFLIFQSVIIFTAVAFTFLWGRGISELSIKNAFFVFLAFFFGILLILLVKYLINKLVSSLFIEWRLNDWTEKYFRIIELSGFLIFIPALFYVFVPEYSRVSLFLLTITFFVIIMAVFRNLLNIFAENRIGLLNYLLYLCAIEIAPLFLIYKGATSIVNIAGY